MEDPRQFCEKPNQSLKDIESIFEDTKQVLKERLRGLTNPYHNEKHSEDVLLAMETLLSNLKNPSLFSDEEKLLLRECALRHDDGHSGRAYRQEVASDNLSNEEYAVALLEQDLRGRLDENYLDFMKKHILATSFGQNEDKKNFYCSYKPETDSQKLLAFADVSAFTKGWDEWVNISFLLLEESPQNCPTNIDSWITNQEGFVNFHISPLIESINHLLKPEYLEKLKQALDAIKDQLNAVKEKSDPKRIEYKNRLNIIRESLKK